MPIWYLAGGGRAECCTQSTSTKMVSSGCIHSPFQRTLKTGYALLSPGSQNTEGCAAQFGQKLSDQYFGDIGLGVPWMYSQS